MVVVVVVGLILGPDTHSMDEPCRKTLRFLGIRISQMCALLKPTFSLQLLPYLLALKPFPKRNALPPKHFYIAEIVVVVSVVQEWYCYHQQQSSWQYVLPVFFALFLPPLFSCISWHSKKWVTATTAVVWQCGSGGLFFFFFLAFHMSF